MKGIYKITNVKNNKFYIGKSQNIFKRWDTHMRKLIKNKHINKELQNDFNVGRIEDFKFEVVEILDDNCSYNELSELELKYIKEFKSRDIDVGYNFDQGNNIEYINKQKKATIERHKKRKEDLQSTYGVMTTIEYFNSMQEWFYDYYNIKLNHEDIKDIITLLEKKRNQQTYITITEIGEGYGLDKRNTSFINQTYIYVPDIKSEVKKWICNKEQEAS